MVFALEIDLFFRKDELLADTFEIVHSLPGRMRVRVKAMRDDSALALGMQDLLNSQDGVRLARANSACASITIQFNPEAFNPVEWFRCLKLEQVPRLKPCHNGQAKLPAPLAAIRRGTFAFESLVNPKAQFVLACLSLAASLVPAPPLLTKGALSVALLPILNRALQTLLDERRLGGDALDGASCILLLKEGSFMPAAVMATLVGLGEMMRDFITKGCQRMISHQLALSQRSVWLISGDRRVRVPVLELRPGDQLVVYPGELIACEGTVLKGSGTIVPAGPDLDFAPQFVSVGATVTPDTLLVDGKLYLRNDRNSMRKPHDPVHEKQKRRWLQRTRLQRFALHDAYERVWPILALASLVFAASKNVHRAAAVICFDFITGIRIAIPTAVLSSMYRAGRTGVVIRNASTLERLAETDAVVFARSGTLTQLKPTVKTVHVMPSYTLEQVTRLAAAVQQRYSYMGAYAICSYANMHSIPVPERTTSSVIPGLGIAAEVEGHKVLVGSTRLMQEKGIEIAAAHEFLDQCIRKGDSRLCISIDGTLAGVIAYEDPVRAEAAEAVAGLEELGIKEIAMMTSGSPDAAAKLAKQAGITKVHARALPEDMATIIKEYKQRGLKVAVVGYDVADSLAMEQADVAITLGQGADVARLRADMVLTSESLSGLVDGIKIAREGMALARQNLAVVSAPNWLGLGLSIVNEADFLTATLLNNGSVIVGAANGLRPLLDSGDKNAFVVEKVS